MESAGCRVKNEEGGVHRQEGGRCKSVKGRGFRVKSNLPSQEFFVSKRIVERISIRELGEPLCFGVFQLEGQGWFQHLLTSNRTTSRSTHVPRKVNKPTNLIFKLRAAVHSVCQLL